MNKKIWEYYKQTSEYKNLTATFSVDKDDVSASAEKIFQLCKNMGDTKSANDHMDLFENVLYNFIGQEYSFSDEATRNDFEAFIDSFELFELEFEDDEVIIREDRLALANDNYRRKCSCMDTMSVFLYSFNPFFKPILLSSNFSLIRKSCENLDIELPAMPQAHDYKGALMWYYDMCSVFDSFQKEYGMSCAEFCACLYGLGPSLEEEQAAQELPMPINVWLTGASKEDYKGLERSMDNDSVWSCNENTRRGDIVVIYAVSPNSCIHSIWRANSEGNFNPFDYFQCRTKVTNGVKITPLKLDDLKADPEFGRLPMLNNNFQGVNGKRLPSWAYSALLKMIEANGDDMSRVPVLFEARDWNPGTINSEHDVEEKILIPALKGLGYTEGDWTRQLRLKAGRGEKAIPDFVFFPHGEERAEVAPLVIEAKWHMSSEKERNDAYRQGRSYAKMLESGLMGICDDERLIIYKKSSNGSFNYSTPVFEAVWAAIAGNEETHDSLMQLIGAEVIKGNNNIKQ